MKLEITKDQEKKNMNLNIPEIRVWNKARTRHNVFNTFKKAFEYIKANKETESTPVVSFRGYEIDLYQIK